MSTKVAGTEKRERQGAGRRRGPILVVVAALTSLVAMAHPGLASAAPSRPVGTIRLGANKQLPPFEFLNEYDMFKGFNVDLVNALAIETNQDIEVYPMSWALARISLDRGYVDGLQGMPRTPDVANEYDFTDPYLTVQGRIVVRRESSNIVDIEDLKGHRVAVEKDSAAHRVLGRYSAVDLVLLNSQVEAIEALLSGDVDAAIAYEVTGRYVAEKWRKTDEIKITGEPVFESPYCIALVKGNPQIVAALNSGLRSLKKKGIYDRIYEKWFGRPVDSGRYLSQQYLYRIIYALGAAMLVALFSLGWNYVLKREVRIRTLELKDINMQLEEQRKAIAERDAFKEQILNSVGSGIVTLDRTGRIVTLNEAAMRYLFPSGGAGREAGATGLHYGETPLATFVDPSVVIMPFIFAVYPQMLLLNGWTGDTLLVLGLTVIAVVAASAAFEGYLLLPMTVLERVLMLGTTVLLMRPGVVTGLTSIVACASVVALQLRRAKRSQPAPAQAAGS